MTILSQDYVKYEGPFYKWKFFRSKPASYHMFENYKVSSTKPVFKVMRIYCHYQGYKLFCVPNILEHMSFKNNITPKYKVGVATYLNARIRLKSAKICFFCSRIILFLTDPVFIVVPKKYSTHLVKLGLFFIQCH